jgi:hypothetical protein
VTHLARHTLLALLITILAAPLAWAQAQPPAPVPAADEEDPDLEVNVSQPDFTLQDLPTNLRLPKGKFAFRVTHRFSRPLADGDFGDLLADFFGFDSGALIGLELRYGLWRGAQIGINRTSNRDIQMFTQYELTNQQHFPVGISAWGSINGTNNFRDSYSPALGAVISRELGPHGALYAQPMWVNNSNPEPKELVEDNDTFMLGLGTRLRVRPSVYVTAEFAPRLGGYEPGEALMSFGVEKRVGGHSFSLNFSNSFATTMAPIARGGNSNDDWYIGFNIARKFY